MSKDRKSFLGGRDNKSGQFVPLRETKQRPESTTREHVPLPGRGDTGRYDKTKNK
jgi:hypothetical protein